MEDHAPTNDTPTNGSAAEQPPAAIALTGADAGGSLTNADIAALSRERQQTLLSILPPAVAAILITNRPPMPPHVEYEAHKRLVAAQAKARGKIPSVPMDKTVDYVSKRTGERVHYSFASPDSISKSITEPLAEYGLVLECVFNDKTIRGPAQPRGRRGPPVMAAAARRGRHQGPGHADHDAAPLSDGAADRHRRRRGHRRARHRGAEEARRTAQGRAGPAAQDGRPGRRPRRRSRRQAPAPARSRPAKEPHRRAAGEAPQRTSPTRLREQYKDPNELLRRTTEELNRRNAAASRGADAPADGNGTAKPTTEQPGSGAPPANDGRTPAAQTPADARLEKTINEGMRALRLSADKQADLRKQFPNDPQGLLKQIKALYNAGHGSQNLS